MPKKEDFLKELAENGESNNTKEVSRCDFLPISSSGFPRLHIRLKEPARKVVVVLVFGMPFHKLMEKSLMEAMVTLQWINIIGTRCGRGEGLG
ncbi:hypothetical protein FNV43_RR02706 [Rhamnella rubrinervis]|uniref:Uncharacterized protein n=1 Tax=Rhamnella rubrinervis TaxID=2594499 RepID=A0A8K0MNK7_9ROSA|nr:hypothetical protein FNV43_RR02706 [Rhamnella rubrinervis]